MLRAKRTILTALLLFGATSAANAALLDFKPKNACSPGIKKCKNYDLIDQSYGDGKGVDFIWGDQSLGDAPGLQYWNKWGGTKHAVFAGVDDDESIGQIDIVAMSGYLVTLSGFDLAAWEEDRTSQWMIEDLAGGVLASSGGTVDVLYSSLTSIITDFTSGAGFRITWGPNGYNVGLDNLHYSVASEVAASVPEPAMILLLGLGLAGLGLRKR